jgi:hypothetical protein
MFHNDGTTNVNQFFHTTSNSGIQRRRKFTSEQVSDRSFSSFFYIFMQLKNLCGMTEKELQEMVKHWENLYLIVDQIDKFPEYADMLINIGLDESEPENWRALWMVDKIHDKHPELVLKHLPVLTEFVMKTKNSGKMRHVLKLISLHDIPEPNLAELLNFCINIFSNAAVPVAVRVHAMQILYNIAEKEPDFSGELVDLIEHEMEFHGSAGIKSRGKKLISKLLSIQKQL